MADLPTLRARVEAARAKVRELGDDFWHLYLLAIAIDLLAALDVSGRRHRHRDDVEKDMARQRDEARAEITAIRAALGNGADEAAWPPGLTLAEAVGRLRSSAPRCRVLVSSRWIGGTMVDRRCLLPAGHEGSHAEAMGDNGGPND